MQLSLPHGHRRRLFLALLGSVLLGAAKVAAAAPPINTLNGGVLGGRGETAIQGYDPVAYFSDGKPVKGKDAFSFEWMGATWKFASQAHLDQFRADPQRYAPQYGGYCAYGVTQDALVEIEPDKFSIIDGKLYLNYNADVQARWSKDSRNYIQQADAKFKGLLK